VGSVLLAVVNKPGNFLSTISVQDDGAGDVTVEWNSHTPPTFHNVSRIVLDGRGRSNLVSFALTGNVTLAHEVDVRLDGTNSGFIQNLGGLQTNGMSGFEVETAPAPRNLAKGP
jgi:hypothetical protein